MNKFIVLLLASSIVVNVYSQTITLDNTFGQNGKIIIPNTSEILFFDFDGHGNIIAVGYPTNSGEKSDLTIVKTNVNGIIDESFGNNGVVKITDYEYTIPLGMKITNDNKIVVIGSFSNVEGGYKNIMMRFNENGTVDQNFGDSGKVNLNTGYIMSLNLESDDFILIAKLDDYQIAYILKYNYEGEIDESFGENGTVHLTNSIRPRCIKVFSDGSVIIAGTYNSFPNTELGLGKLTPVGEVDTDFANNGIWHLDVEQDFDFDHESFYGIFEDNNGNLILFGSGRSICGPSWSGAFLSKFSSNGILDTDFGEAGFYCSNTGISLVSQIENIYILAGYHNSGYKITIIDNDGKIGKEAYTCGIYYLRDMKLQGNNKIILGGGNKASNAESSLERVVLGLETSIKPNEYSSKDLVIFPNPANGNLYFSDETAFEIINIQGKILLKSITPVAIVDISNLGTGIYFVRVENSVHKFVKE